MSETEHSLKQSIEMYQSQLKQIQDALLVATEDQKSDLEQIEKDLEEIIQLTQTNLSSITEQQDATTPEESHLEEELDALEGVKCKAPFSYEWGGHGYHNAIIMGCEMTNEGEVCVKAVFMHPTTKKMQPCPYYLEGNCKYSDEKCHYSHGYTVKLEDVQDYKDPDYSKITEGCTVLAKYKDGLWYRATVEDIIKGTQFSVKFFHCNDVLLLDLHSVYPIDEEDSDDSSSSDEDDGEEQFAPRHVEDYHKSHYRHVDDSFGNWEKHTRGIGSVLMAKMGYVLGAGLGKEGEGRIEPVEAMVFPPGRSLDRCMELRERAGEGNILSVEKKLEREKAKTEHRLRQLASKAERDNSVFDFINSKLSKNGPKGSKGDASKSQPKMADLSQLSRQKLNVQSLQVGEEIRRVERDVVKIKQSLQRQSDRGDLASVSQIRIKLAEKEKELDRLRASDRTISNEQTQRKSSSKLTIF